MEINKPAEHEATEAERSKQWFVFFFLKTYSNFIKAKNTSMYF